MMQRQNPNRNPDDLNRLLQHGAGYARHMMKTTGSVPPTLMADTPEGMMLFIPKTMGNENDKDAFANAGRLLAIGHKATSVMLILEAWMTLAKHPGEAVPNVPPSQSPDRKEVVVLMAEARGVRAQQFLFIERDWQQRFTGFGTSLVPQFDKIEGRFARMMPPKEPSNKDARLARLALRAMGVAVETLGSNPIWN